MKIIEYNSKRYNIPTDWSDVTVERYAQFKHELESGEATTYKWLFKLIGIPHASFVNFPVQVASAIIQMVKPLLDSQPPTDPVFEFEHLGITYNVNKAIAFPVWGQHLDADAIMRRAERKDNADSMWSQMPRLLSVLCLPKGQTYEQASPTFEDRVEAMRTLPIDKGMRVAAFFLLVSKGSKVSTKSFLQRLKTLNHSLRVGIIKSHIPSRFTVGFTTRISWLTTTLLNLILLRERLLSRY